MNARISLAVVTIILGMGMIFVNTASSEEIPTCNGFPATIVGTEEDDYILGTPGDDIIVGLGGNDHIIGDDGNDIICGGDGDDRIFGGKGNDLLYGQNGNDLLEGGEGVDTILEEGPLGSDSVEPEPVETVKPEPTSNSCTAPSPTLCAVNCRPASIVVRTIGNSFSRGMYSRPR